MPSQFKTIRLLKEGQRDRYGRRHTRNVKGCKFCDRSILWCETEAGKPIPFEEIPDPVASDARFEEVSTEHVHFGKCPGYERRRA